MFFDPMYFLFLAPGMLLSMWAAWKTKGTFKKYSRVRTMSGMTGAQAAQMMLDRAGITDVKISPTKGFLSDHYNPLTKTLALSQPVFGQPSISAVGVACHEAGHAIQHAKGYAPLKLRSALVPVASVGSKFSMWAIMGGFLLGMAGLIWVGVAMFAVGLVFQLVTLPVEFDASARAKKLAADYGIVAGPESEGVERVLSAAAWTYVAAAVTSVLTLLYFLMRLGVLGGRD